MEKPTALILDFGGVITKTLFETHNLTEQEIGLAPGTLNWMGPFDPESDSLWRDMQAGMITERDYWLHRSRETGALIGQDWTRMEDLLIAARSKKPIEIIRPEAIVIISRVKAAGFQVAILSNELDLFYGIEFRSKLPFLSDVDLVVDATYTKILKPDPASYAFVTDGLDVSASACVYVDDQQRNITGAEAVGMKTVAFDVKQPGKSFQIALAAFGLANNQEENGDEA